jgi:thioredoxin 1
VRIRFAFAVFLTLLIATLTAPLCQAQAANSPMLQVEAWRKAVLAGDTDTLASMYADSAKIIGPGQKPSDLRTELAYWSSWKGRGLKTLSAEVESQQEPQPGYHVVLLQLTIGVAESGGARKYFVTVGQGYLEQGANWKIAAEQRDAETRLKGPARRKDLYPAGVDAQKEISEALQSAAKSNKRVLLIFGGNWCYDCHVLDEAFHLPEVAPLLNHNFVVAHIDVGEYNKNLDLAKKYEIPLERGVPAAAVLDSDGKLLFSQKNQEFEKAHALGPEDIVAFLNKWKPTASR